MVGHGDDATQRGPLVALMPNQPKTPLRTVRISEEVWAAAMRKAIDRGETVSDVIRRALVRYSKRP